MISSMENRFKADLNGWLEQESQHNTIHTRIFTARELPKDDHDEPPYSLLDSLDLTLNFYGYSAKAHETLHRTVFNAVLRNQDYEIDFDVPRFKVGMDHRVLHHISERFGLHQYTLYELWKLTADDALEFIYTTWKMTQTSLPYFHKMYIKLLQRVPLSGIDTRWLSEQIRIDDSDDLVLNHVHSILQVFYECFLEIQQRSSDSRGAAVCLQYVLDALQQRKLSLSCESTRLLFDMMRLTGIKWVFQDDTKPHEKELAVQTCQHVRMQRHSLKYEWTQMMKSDDSFDSHEEAFMLICLHIQARCLVSATDSQTIDLNRLQAVIMQHENSKLQTCKQWCCFMIQHQSSFWRSVLKVMIQFMDLWINDIQIAECADIMASLIAQENMIPILYHHILKHVQRNEAISKNLCELLQKSIESLKTIKEILHVRDYIFHHRGTNENIQLPVFGSTTIWNIPFELEIVKFSNQITTDEEDMNKEVPDALVRKIAMLSVIWPYEVVRVLFMSCMKNKNQYQAIVPVLKRLGHLCRLQISSDEHSLLLYVIITCIQELEEDEIQLYQDNMIQFIKACCDIENGTVPILLLPDSVVEQSRTPLCLKQVLNLFVMENLISFANQATCSKEGMDLDSNTRSASLTSLSLHLLDALCDSDDIIGFIRPHDLPALLYCNPENWVFFMTELLSTREEAKAMKVSLKSYELALKFIQKFTILLHYIRLPSFFETISTEYDWKLQLLWYPLLQEKTLKVPPTIFKLTGSLDGLFSCDDEVIKVNPDWLDLFEACKRSRLLTDKLFERASQWTYQLLLLWTCPEKDTIIVPGFTRVLHPMYSPSCSLEYTNLIVHFLDRLYDSTDFHDMIKQDASTEYSVFIQRLSAKGTKIYFKVCYIARLLKSSDLQQQQETYYISNMIGILQGLLQWGDIGKRGQARSYSELKERITYGPEPLVDLCYPLLVDAEMRSDRALSILTLAHLVEWKPARSELREIVNRLVMQIVEGLVDPESGQQFERMVSQQPKSRYVAFKKRSRQTPELCKEITRRPVLMSDERALLESRLVENEWSQVLNINNDTSDKRLYFICRKID